MKNGDHKSGRLDSWKDIAAYVGRDVRTVIRWEKQKGLPVHRIPGGQRKAVFAYVQEIDRWRSYGQVPHGPDLAAASIPDPAGDRANDTAAVSKTRAVPRLMWVGALFPLVVGTAFALHYFANPRSIQVTAISQVTEDGLQKNGLVTDGKSLYFGEFSDGRMQLKKMLLQGRSVESIDTPIPNVRPVDISPDGSHLLAFDITGPETEHPLWVVSLRNGHSAERVGTIVGHSAAWSPNGQRIAYAAGDSIYVTTNTGTDARRLAVLGAIPTQLHWSNDVSKLLFILENPATGSRSPWEISLDSGGSLRALSPITLPVRDCCNSWSRQSQNGIYFVAPKEHSSALWAIIDEKAWRNESVHAVPLKIRLGDEVELAAAPSRGEMFVLSDNLTHSELFLFDSTRHEFTPYLPGISATSVDFSPDGQWIAYERTTDRTLWISRADGTHVRQIKFPMDDVELPRWSPDGKRIAFMAKQENKPWRIFIAAVDGMHLEEASTGDDNQGAPTWSPDGRSILYANVECQTTHSCAIRRINLVTHEVDVLPGSQGMRTARWSPDGRDVAALKQDFHQLYLYSFTAQRWRKLADDATGDDVSWSSDSRYVYMSRPTGIEPQIVRIPVAGGEEESIIDLRPWDGDVGNYATAWFTLAPDGAILIGHTDTQPEIFGLDWSD